MTFTIINAFLFVTLFVASLFVKKRITPSIVLLLVYAFVSIMGIIYYDDFIEKRHIVLFPFVYLFVICVLFFYPIISNKIESNIYTLKVPNGIKIFVYLYVIFSIVRIIQIGPLTIENIQSGDWLLVKDNATNNDIGITDNFFQTIAKQYILTFMPGMVAYSFYTFTKKEYTKLSSSLLLMISVTPDVMNSLLFAYRGGLFTTALTLISSYFLYINYISAAKKKFLHSALFILGCGVFLLTIAISFSRFGESDTGSSLVHYLGQSMLMFNGGLASRIHTYANGAYFFQCFNNMTRDDIWVDSKYGISTGNGSAFDTFVGVMYLDFGPILTFIIAVVISIYLHSLFNKKHIIFANVYLYSFYMNYLFLGVFHSPMGYARNIILMIIMYNILRIFNRRFKIVNFLTNHSNL